MDFYNSDFLVGDSLDTINVWEKLLKTAIKLYKIAGTYTLLSSLASIQWILDIIWLSCGSITKTGAQ